MSDVNPRDPLKNRILATVSLAFVLPPLKVSATTYYFQRNIERKLFISKKIRVLHLL